MPFEVYSDADYIDRLMTAEFQVLLRHLGRNAPAFVRSEVIEEATEPYFRLTITFSDGQIRHSRIDKHRLTEQGRRDILHPRFELNLRSMWSRLFEDHLLELDISVARESFTRAVAAAGTGSECAAAQRNFNETCRLIRAAHHGGQQNPHRVWGVDLGRADSQLTFQTIGIGVRGDGTPIDRIDLSQSTYTISDREVLGHETATELRQHQIDAMSSLLRLRIDQEVYRHFNFETVAVDMMSLTFGDVGTQSAQNKGLKLLKSWLSTTQRAQYKKFKYFDVIGGDTGKRYRIHHGRQQNIHELDAAGKVVTGLCFLPEGQLVAGDCMLAQKIALETNERQALAVAHRF